jgi:hypothetical protein
VLVVLRQRGGDDAAGRLHRRAAEAGAALGAAGVTLNILDGPETAACLARALDPAGTTRLPGLAGAAGYDTDEPITLAQPARRPPNRAVH